MLFYLCGHDCDVDLVVFVACEHNSSVVLNTKIKHTWQQIWLEKKNPLELFTPKFKS